jgi:sugar-specific transcriptional regulator TrmB
MSQQRAVVAEKLNYNLIIQLGKFAREGKLSIKEELINLLVRLGITKTAAKLYLILAKMKKADGKTLSVHANLPSPAVYRALDELRKKGLAEKEITQPYTFRATPIPQAVQMLTLQKFEECKEIQEKTEVFLREMQFDQENIPSERDYQIVMIDKKERIIQRVRNQHDNAHHRVDILTTMQRLLQFLHNTLENHERALDRGVHYRVLVQESIPEKSVNKDLETLLSKPNFELRVMGGISYVNAVVFDDEVANFVFYPSKPISETPIICTNHPVFIRLVHEHFENVWKHSHKFKMQDAKRKNGKRKT